jgi:nucleotide-binding universal stress UspA family protein
MSDPPPGGVGSGTGAPSGSPPRFGRLLLALDTKPPGPRLRWIVGELVHRYAAELIACHVVMRSTSVAGDERDGAPADAAETAVLATLRGQLIEILGAPGERAPIRILHGDPGERICEHARFAGCDLIVLESRERTFARRLRGSVSKYVAGSFGGSVLIVGD